MEMESTESRSVTSTSFFGSIPGASARMIHDPSSSYSSTVMPASMSPSRTKSFR